MNIQEISLGGFGVLSKLELDGLRCGLNVIHGRNGSGKTTLLRFLRGILCGFEEARRLRLLPPLREGQPGGSLTMHVPGGTCEVSRHFRPNHMDTLAIRLIRGSAEVVEDLRRQVHGWDRDFVHSVCTVPGDEALLLDPVIRLALRDGIELKSHQQEAHWLHARMHEIESERADLFQGSPSRGAIVHLEQRREELSQSINRARQEQQAQQEHWYGQLQQAQLEISRWEATAENLFAELQAVECDLTEAETRLWNAVGRTPVTTQIVYQESTSAASEETLSGEIAGIDMEIAHAQQVLRDLAGSRMSLSLIKAGLTGSEIPDAGTALARQRSALAMMEHQADRLGNVLSVLNDPRDRRSCVCRELQPQVNEALGALRRQIAMLCQELGRQQSAHEQSLILSERDGIDRCELELTRQIQRLRLRREELLDRSSDAVNNRICHRTHHEALDCGCETHGPVQATDHIPVKQAVVPQQASAATVSNPESIRRDRTRQQELTRRKQELFQQWQATCDALNEVRGRLRELERQPQEFAEDSSVLTLRHEYAAVEQQLADAREQWESLAVLQLVLQKTQQQLQVETVSAVIEDASRLLGDMTEGRYRGFRFIEDRSALHVISESGAELPLEVLSRGTRDQAALSFRIAIWQEYGRRGLDLPLILDDVLADSDEHRLHAAARMLATLTDQRQILFLTCQEHLANLFESLGAHVLDLPGSLRARSTSVIPAPHFTPTAAGADAAASLEGESEGKSVSLNRVQPDEPYWLQAHSPVGSVPSLGEQMARRLGALGVRVVADLIELDPEQTEIPLDSLQISAATLRLWQAEARLLVCVVHLTGRGAPLLASVGIHHPTELAQIDATELSRRIQNWRTQVNQVATLAWLTETPEGPSLETLERWVRHGRAARSYRQARDWSIQRRLKNRQRGLPQRAETGNRGRPAVASVAMTTASTVVEPPQTVRLYQAAVPTTTERKFYLQLDSPIVDAPSIGPKTAERLEKIGIMTVSHLVTREAVEIATRLNRQRITAETVTAWQQQAQLVCRIPELRGHDAQVLVACGITTAEEVARYSPAELFRIVGPFVSSKEGQRLLRSAKTPDLDEVTGWIDCARHSRSLRAA